MATRVNRRDFLNGMAIGAQNLENPGAYSENASGLLADLGITPEALDAMGASMPVDYALAGSIGAANAMSLPGSVANVTVAGNWIMFMHGKGDYVAAVRELPLPTVEQTS